MCPRPTSGHGASDLEPIVGAPCCKVASVDECKAQCDALADCESVVVSSTAPRICYRRGAVNLPACQADWLGFDTYIRPTGAPRPGAPAAAGTGGSDIELRVMSFNIWFAEHSPERLDGLAEALSSAKPDVASLQECVTARCRTELLSRLRAKSGLDYALSSDSPAQVHRC